MSDRASHHPTGDTGRRRRRFDAGARPLGGHRRRREPLALILFAVFTAGVLGTAGRLGIDAVLPSTPGGIPVSTLLINTGGSFALGMAVAVVPHSAPEWLRAAVTTGFLGAFTTFSALTVASAALTGSGRLVSAGMLLFVSIVAGLLAATAGMLAGAALARRSA